MKKFVIKDENGRVWDGELFMWAPVTCGAFFINRRRAEMVAEKVGGEVVVLDDDENEDDDE